MLLAVMLVPLVFLCALCLLPRCKGCRVFLSSYHMDPGSPEQSISLTIRLYRHLPRYVCKQTYIHTGAQAIL